MGWSVLPEPGKVVRGEEIGPCKDKNCGHTHCELTRKMAETECMICGEPIGYETPFYNHTDEDGEQGLVHVRCLR